MNIVGYLHGRDSSACVLVDGHVASYIEEERLIRQKHAVGIFPIRAIEACLEQARLNINQVDSFAYGYDGHRFANGEIAAFYEGVNRKFPPDKLTRAWQEENLRKTAAPALEARLRKELLRYFGETNIPPLRYFPHHRAHAVATLHFAPFRDALILVLDGSGDHQCTTVWKGSDGELELLFEINIPHSLGWFYAAITEYLGFESYDGEYKVMGLAAYGQPNAHFREALGQLLRPGPMSFDYVLDRNYIHNGPHSFSHRFTDHLIRLLGIPPRPYKTSLSREHEDLAFEAQWALEETVLRLMAHFGQLTGIRNLAIGGGVAQNVKMNGRLHDSGLFDEVSIFPIPSDSGTAVGAALGVYQEAIGRHSPTSLHDVYWGPSYQDKEISAELQVCGIPFIQVPDIAECAAELLARGKIVGWFQGRMEAGPRALGARSILADPRNEDTRDKVNRAIKYREYWRPFCPSMTLEAADKFLVKPAAAPFMIITFRATDTAKKMIPAVVHVDGTLRVQTVQSDSNPLFYKLIKSFEKLTGVPVLLNTSFNLKGEPIVCSPKDAIRTFWSSGLDALAIGSYLVTKPASVS